MTAVKEILTAPWSRSPVYGLDTETTGTDPRTARVLSYALTLCDSIGVPADSSRQVLINPGVEIPAEATEIHGLTQDRIEAEGLAPEDALSRLACDLDAIQRLGIPLVVFNAPYDLTLLWYEWERLDKPVPWLDGLRVIDPLVIDRQHARWRKGKGARTLGALAQEFGVWLPAAHNSFNDAVAAVGIAYAMAKRWDAVARLSTSQLHESQRGWYSAWSNNLNGWLRRKGEPPIQEKWPYGYLHHEP